MENVSLCKIWTLAPCQTLQCEGWEKDKHGVLNTQSRKKEEQGTLFSVFASSAGLRAVGCALRLLPAWHRGHDQGKGLVTPSQKSSHPLLTVSTAYRTYYVHAQHQGVSGPLTFQAFC